MDLSVTPTGALTLARIHPDEGRRRRPSGVPDRATPAASPAPSPEDPFDSTAPVVVGAATEAAVADLRPVAGVPLAEALQRYARR